MKLLIAAGLLLTESTAATSIGGIVASTGNLCVHTEKASVAFVGKVNGWSVVVETVVKGSVHPQAEYKLSKPLGYRLGERYLILADAPQPDGVLNVREARDAQSFDARIVRALRESVSGRGPKLFGSLRFDNRKPAGGLVPVSATGPNGIERKALTQPGGFFEFQNIPPGDYKLTLGEASLDDPAAPVLLVPTITQVPSQGCAMSGLWVLPNGWIEGIVRDVDGSPVPNAKVHAYTNGQTREVNADAEGRYRFRGLPKNRYRLAHGNSSVSVDLKDREGRSGVDLRIPPKIEYSDLTVEIVDSDGRPVNGAEVFLYSPPPASVRTFLPSGNMLSLRLARDEFYSVAARLWRDGRQWAGNSGSIRLEVGGAIVRVTLM